MSTTKSTSKTPSNPLQGVTKTAHEVTKPLKKLHESAFMREFREFINRGSIMDLAIGVAVGGAFTAIAKSLVDDIIMPIASLLAGGLDFSTLAIDIPNFFGADSTAHIAYGNFIQNVVNFLVIAFAVFLIIRAINRFNRKKDAADAKSTDAKSADTKSAGAKSTAAKLTDAKATK